MDNLSSFIYIIIIAAIIFNGLWGVLRRSKTQEGEILPPFDPRQQPHTAPTLEVPESKESETVPAPQPAQPTHKRKARHPLSTTHSPLVPNRQPIADNKQEEIQEETLFENPDDWRKAIIYSEILHRKYQ